MAAVFNKESEFNKTSFRGEGVPEDIDAQILIPSNDFDISF